MSGNKLPVGDGPVQVSFPSNLDRFHDGLVDGWGDLGGKSQVLKVRIDKAVDIPAKALLYREDLAAAGIRSGYAAFSVPVPCFLLDGQSHQIELLPADADSRAQSRISQFKFDVPNHIRLLERSIVSVSGTIKRVKDQQIALLCGYQANGVVSPSTLATIRALQQAGFKVIYILAADYPPIGDKPLETPADVNILRRNGGYDFGSWATGYHYLRTKLPRGTPESVLLINDSMLWTGQPLDGKFLRFNRGGVEFDILGASESYDRRFHLQSFYMLFSKRVVEQNILDEFLLYQGTISSSRDDVISKFELSTYDFFASRGLKVGAAIEYHDLVSQLWGDLSEYVESHQRAFVSEALARHGGFHDVLNWMNTIRNGSAINPSHTGWLQLVRNGFPFVKKEIILKNPVRVPFFEKIRSSFQGQALVDLDDFVRFNSGCLIPAAASMAGAAVPTVQLKAVSSAG